MMPQLQPVLDALLAKYGWGPAALSWISGLTVIFRLVIKPFNLRLQAALNDRLVEASQDPEDAAWWHDKVLTRGWYRFGAFFLDAFFSVKLPTHASFNKALASNIAGQLAVDGSKPQA